MRQNNRKVGSTYERLAGEYLEKQGYQILEYNFRYRQGEIDIIAKDGDYLVFCEVKYRKDTNNGHPLEAVDFKKQKVISKCARYYVTIHKLGNVACRFDVIGILNEKITLIKNAFEYVG